MVLVDQGGIDVSVPIANGVFDLSDAMIRVCGFMEMIMTYSVLDFLRLRQPGTEAELRNGGAGG